MVQLARSFYDVYPLSFDCQSLLGLVVDPTTGLYLLKLLAEGSVNIALHILCMQARPPGDEAPVAVAPPKPVKKAAAKPSASEACCTAFRENGTWTCPNSALMAHTPCGFEWILTAVFCTHCIRYLPIAPCTPALC